MKIPNTILANTFKNGLFGIILNGDTSLKNCTIDNNTKLIIQLFHIYEFSLGFFAYKNE